MESYPYSQGDLIEKPQTYFYTPYGGIDFLRAWKDARDAVSASCGSALPPPAGNMYAASLQDCMESIEHDEMIDAAVLLENIYVHCIKPQSGEEQLLQSFVDKLVKKFEVTKRWYRSYGPGLRAHGRGEKSAYSDFSLYLRAAEIFEVAYTKFKKPPYLNVLLKSLDTLSSVHEKLVSEDQRRLAWLLERERDHVVALAKSAGIAL